MWFAIFIGALFLAIILTPTLRCPECESRNTNHVPYGGGYTHCNNCGEDF
jgi:hypothetical protein